MGVGAKGRVAIALVAYDLIANAVEHARPPIQVRMGLAGEVIRVECTPGLLRSNSRSTPLSPEVGDCRWSTGSSTAGAEPRRQWRQDRVGAGPTPRWPPQP
jgi:hypothetical protein